MTTVQVNFSTCSFSFPDKPPAEVLAAHDVDPADFEEVLKEA